MIYTLVYIIFEVSCKERQNYHILTFNLLLKSNQLRKIIFQPVFESKSSYFLNNPRHTNTCHKNQDKILKSEHLTELLSLTEAFLVETL